MPVEIQFIDEQGQPIQPSGIDYGTSRKGVPNITKFKIKNSGNVTARDSILLATTFSSSTEVNAEEYTRQLLAQKWKSFSLYPDHSFQKQLNLGNIKPGKYVEGTKQNDVDFHSADTSILKEDWTTGITTYIGGTQKFSKLEDEPKGQVAKRLNCPTLSPVRDLEVEFKAVFNSIEDVNRTGNPFIAFPVRINSKGDGKGYMFFLHYRQSDKKFMISIYKNSKGMTSNMERDYGTKIFDTILWQAYDSTKKFTFRIFNNSLEQPTFEVKYGGTALTLGKALDSAISGTQMSDKALDSYVEAGSFYLDTSLYDGDKSVVLSDMILKTEETQQLIYMRSLLEDTAENQTTYMSSVCVSYLED